MVPGGDLKEDNNWEKFMGCQFTPATIIKTARRRRPGIVVQINFPRQNSTKKGLNTKRIFFHDSQHQRLSGNKEPSNSMDDNVFTPGKQRK